MAKEKSESTVAVEKSAYKINSKIQNTGFSANYKAENKLIVISVNKFKVDVDPMTGQYGSVLDFPSKVFINGKERATYDIPADLDMKIIFSLGQAGIIEFTDEQAKEYNAFAKQLHSGKIK